MWKRRNTWNSRMDWQADRGGIEVKQVERLKDLPAGTWRVSNEEPEKLAERYPDRDIVYYRGTPINGREWYVCMLPPNGRGKRRASFTKGE